MDIELKYISCLFQSSAKISEAERLKIEPSDFNNATYRKAFQILKNAKEMGIYRYNREIFITQGIEPAEYDDCLKEEFEKPKDEVSYEHYSKMMVSNIFEKKKEKIFNSYQEKIKKATDFKVRAELNRKMYGELNSLAVDLEETQSKTFTEISNDMLDGKIKNTPVPSGFDWLDEKIGGGFISGVPSIVAGDSGHGKSLIMKNGAIRQALPKEYGGKDMKVLVVSMELKKENLVEQMIAILSESPMQENKFYLKLKAPQKEKVEFEKKVRKLAPLLANLTIEDGSFTPEQLAIRIHKAKKEGYQCVWVDYFQHLYIEDSGGDGNAYNRASMVITKAIKEVESIAVVLLSQVTGDSGKATKTPQDHQNARLRYAKQLTNDTTFELITYRNQVKDDEPDFENKREEINLYLRKNRHGTPEQLITQSYKPAIGLIGTFKAPDLDKIPDAPLQDLDPVEDLKEMEKVETELPLFENPEYQEEDSFDFPTPFDDGF